MTCAEHLRFMVTKMSRFDWLKKKQQKHNGDVKAKIDEKLLEVNALKKHVEAQACPSCGKKTLALMSVEFGPKGWQSGVLCQCLMRGVMTNEGLHFDLPRPPTTEAKQ